MIPLQMQQFYAVAQSFNIQSFTCEPLFIKDLNSLFNYLLFHKNKTKQIKTKKTKVNNHCYLLNVIMPKLFGLNWRLIDLII